ncbi:hypothetical protein SH2C18_46930 [Clostridium sediminicola]|uniref:zinc ribbon domain-containing protein n=1 Tax=Clostridium sediminicola TaxID=3114879 RepID=UPI0031F1EB9A
MNFEQVEKEYWYAKRAYENGVIDETEYLNKVRNELLVQDENTGKWMLDEETGNWLWFDDLNNEWIRRNIPGYKKQNEEYVVSITAPEPPQIDEEKREEIRQYQMGNVTNEQVKTESEQPKEGLIEEIKEESTLQCNKCGQVVNNDDNFCPSCGNKIEKIKKNFCKHCGKEVNGDNKFCIFCGKEV